MEKAVNNGVYLTFISEPEIEMPNKLNANCITLSSVVLIYSYLL